MTKSPSDQPDKPTKPSGKQVRLSREAAALRANLLKRKEQVRKRQDAKPEADR